MQNFKSFVSLPLGRFRGFFFFSFLLLVSCHDLHQKLYETFHGKKHAVTKDSTVIKDSILKATTDSSLKKKD